MLPAESVLRSQRVEAVRFATPDSLEVFSAVANQPDPAAFRLEQLRASRTLVDAQAALEESFFLGLRLNRGVALDDINDKFGSNALDVYRPIIAELFEAGLLEHLGNHVRLTPRGRLLSNEVFAHFLRDETVHAST
jgi:oxygen-independent coproporphyrinogen-3 oxidase